MKALKKFDENFEEVILVCLLIIISCIMMAQIVARLLNSAFSWSEEAARFLFVWSGFLSISYSIKKRISITIDQLVISIPAKAGDCLRILAHVVMLFYFVYMVRFAYGYYVAALVSGQLSPAMQLPMSVVAAAPMVGFAFAIIRLIQELVIKVMNFGKA